MIDSKTDTDFAAYERASSLKASARPSAPRGRGGVLAALPSHPAAVGTLTEAPSAPPPAVADAGGASRSGVSVWMAVTAAVAVVLVLWARTRRKGR